MYIEYVLDFVFYDRLTIYNDVCILLIWSLDQQIFFTARNRNPAVFGDLCGLFAGTARAICNWCPRGSESERQAVSQAVSHHPFGVSCVNNDFLHPSVLCKYKTWQLTSQGFKIMIWKWRQVSGHGSRVHKSPMGQEWQKIDTALKTRRPALAVGLVFVDVINQGKTQRNSRRPWLLSRRPEDQPWIPWKTHFVFDTLEGKATWLLKMANFFCWFTHEEWWISISRAM